MADEQEHTQQNTSDQNPQKQTPSSGNGNNKALKIILIIVGVLIVLGLLGVALAGFFFQKATEGIFEAATNSDIELSEEGVNVETDKGSFTTHAELPEDFPEEVPLFEPAEVVSSTSQQQDDSASFSVTFRTDADRQEVSDFYERELDDNGWEITTTSTFNHNVHYQAKRNDVRASVTITSGSSGTSFSVAVNR